MTPALKDTLTRAAWTFVQAAAATLLLSATDLYNLAAWKAAVVAGLAAVLSILKNGTLLATAAVQKPLVEPDVDTVALAEQDLPSAPATPLDLTFDTDLAREDQALSYTLSWSASAGADGYLVFYNDDQVAEIEETFYEVTPGNLGKPGTVFDARLFAVVAYNDTGASEPAVLRS